VARSAHTMTILSNGTVLIAGGQTCTTATSCAALSSAEVYDPVAGTFTATSNSMSAARFGASAVLLNSGMVIISGGFDGTNLPAAAEIYNPTQLGFTGGGPSLNTPRFNATSTLLNKGTLLVAGGSTCALPGCPTNAAEIYDPVANTFTSVASGMNVPRFNHTATLMTNGQVVIAGGYSSCNSSCTSEASAELFDPVAGTFSSSQILPNALASQTGTLVANGNILLIGGINAGVTLAGDEWYQPTSLTPAGLVSISITPPNSSLMPGQTQQLIATGTFNDGSTQTLESVIWSSSNPSAAAVSNSPGNTGMVNAQTTGATTITATTGAVGASASLNVAGLVSLTVAPANPTLAVGSGQQITATGTFADGSMQNLTTSVTWTSSNNSVVLIGSTPGFQGFAMGAAVGTSTITATFNGLSANTVVTVQTSLVANAPSLTAVSPTNAVPGMQVVISGSGFGSSQGSGLVWLGTTFAQVVSWNNSQVVATVSPISTSGTAQLQQGGLWSNAVPFNVNTPGPTITITGVSPTSGVPGTQVTITGSGFGATQGTSSQVVLGSTNGAVQSWSDTQIVALVTNGSTSGYAFIEEGLASSNLVPFNVNTPQITSVTPSSGEAGTTVTITGSGFGASQGSGIVWLGSTDGQVVSWSDTQVVTTVASSSVTGVAKIEQIGVWSNVVSFTVPSSTGNSVTIEPDILNLVVGQTQTIQALNSSGQPVTGLTWTSSNTNVVSLSTDDPPILTAVAVGHATITGGTASTDVTVYSSALPIGTTMWSNPGDGSGIFNVVPAVSSPTGIADVFAFQNDGTVQAIKSDGTTAWIASIASQNDFNEVAFSSVPDFQGGLVVPGLPTEARPGVTATTSIMKLDGITGQAYPAYTVNPATDLLSVPPVAHTNGTIFTLDYNNYRPACCTPSGGQYYTGTISVLGINPMTGTQVFSVPLDQSTYGSTSSTSGNCHGYGDDSSHSTSASGAPGVLAGPIIAGDGYSYVVYSYQVETSQAQTTLGCVENYDPGPIALTVTDSKTFHLMVIKTGSDGTSSKIDINDWNSSYVAPFIYYGGSNKSFVQSGAIPVLTVPTPITNGALGALFTWEADMPEYCAAGIPGGDSPGEGPGQNGSCNSQVPAASSFGLATTSGGGLASVNLPGQATPIYPQVQAQDGSFYGAVGVGPSPGAATQYNMVAFDQYGNMRWMIPNDTPYMSTADDGVVGSSSTTYDVNGNITGYVSLPEVQSWTGNNYQYSPLQQIYLYSTPPAAPATPPYWSYTNANLSGILTAPVCDDDRVQLTSEYIQYSADFFPSCFQFLNGVAYAFSYPGVSQTFPFSKLNQDDPEYNDHPDWAILLSSMLTGLQNINAAYGQLPNVTSAYRSPLVEHALSIEQQTPWHPRSRHIHGDAVDVSAGTKNIWDTLHDIGKSTTVHACVEPWQAQAKRDNAGNITNNPYNHVHFDWRPGRCPQRPNPW
jgi:hypothetical protein